jgi:hypothetical protein
MLALGIHVNNTVRNNPRKRLVRIRGEEQRIMMGSALEFGATSRLSGKPVDGAI